MGVTHSSFAYPRLIAAFGAGILLVVGSFLMLIVTTSIGYDIVLLLWLLRYLGLILIFFSGFWYLFHTVIDRPLN